MKYVNDKEEHRAWERRVRMGSFEGENKRTARRMLEAAPKSDYGWLAICVLFAVMGVMVAGGFQ